jgi:hypothetical protein
MGILLKVAKVKQYWMKVMTGEHMHHRKLKK